MNSPDRFDTSTTDRRQHNRTASEGKVQFTIHTSEMSGVANNISKSGILFFTDGDLRVTVEVEQEGEMQKYEGLLVRCERIKGARRGWAVEFDH